MSQNTSVIKVTQLEQKRLDSNFCAQIPTDIGGYCSRSLKLHTYLILLPRLVIFQSFTPTQ
jgi:hypothetical protein